MFSFQTAVFISLVFIGFGGQRAGADDSAAAQPPHIQQAIHGELQLLSSLKNGNMEPVAQRALDILVKEGAERLRQAGQADLADQYEQSWKTDPELRQSLDPRAGIGIMELGDHAPLSKWLADFVTRLNHSSPLVQSFRAVSDINTLNYALAVVIDPRGIHNNWKNGDDRDYIEYRKHFIPFINIVEYWTAYEGCKTAADNVNDILTYVCDPAATKLTAYLARKDNWKLSDWVYWKANGHAAMTTQDDADPLDVTEQDLDGVLADQGSALSGSAY